MTVMTATIGPLPKGQTPGHAASDFFASHHKDPAMRALHTLIRTMSPANEERLVDALRDLATPRSRFVVEDLCDLYHHRGLK